MASSVVKSEGFLRGLPIGKFRVVNQLPVPDGVATLNADEIVLRLKNLKGADTECPQCHLTKWRQPPGDGRGILTVAYYEQGERELIPLVVLICDNCGFVRFHDEEKLHD